MIANGFGATAVLSILFTSFGFLTFGGASSGFILNNYSTRDFSAVLCRVLTIVTLIWLSDCTGWIKVGSVCFD